MAADLTASAASRSPACPRLEPGRCGASPGHRLDKTAQSTAKESCAHPGSDALDIMISLYHDIMMLRAMGAVSPLYISGPLTGE